jgi:DNA adenine methylase
VKPLIKWPGGKSRELKYIIPHIPIDFKDLYDPFVGGGAIYFHCEAEKSYINDKDEDLIDFYLYIKTGDREFFHTLDDILYDWQHLEQISNDQFQQYLHHGKLVKNYNGELNEQIKLGALQITEQIYKNGFSQIIQNRSSKSNFFNKFVNTSISQKLHLTNKMQNSSGKLFDRSNHHAYFETALKSAYYTFIRDLHFNSSGPERTAYFYFLREFCFGSMFRFNSEGKFNIPYGGINYNKKNFKRKVNLLKSDQTKDLFKTTTVHLGDFEDFLSEYPPKKDAFVFFDPPYDTTFSDYSMNEFGKKDQERLANTFESLGCRALMVTKETPFINSLYTPDRGFRISKFNKTYAYNMRGRNDRESVHLIIKNY